MIKLNNQFVNVTMFPDNTSQVWKLSEELLTGHRATITWDFSNEAEFMQIAQLKNLLDHNKIKSTLYISYLPYGRQDKPVSNTTTFALTTFANLLNSLEFDSIEILDPHSIVATDLIKNSKAVYPARKIYDIAWEHADMICYPDKGAREKYLKLYTFPCEMIFGDKVRDQLTGHITSFKFDGNVKDKRVLIVDDICDGGATFTILAKDLLASGAKSVVLFVTHGIFSKGTRVLFDAGIKRVFTKDGEESIRSRSIQL